MTAAQMKTIIASEAAKHGFAIDRTDLRSNVYFLRRGTEVRRGWTFRRMDEATLMISVSNAVSHGRRMETERLSMYFNPEA